MPLGVLLAEEETLARKGLRLLLEGDFRVVGSVGDAESLCLETRRPRPDVVVAGLVVLASSRDDARADPAGQRGRRS